MDNFKINNYLSDFYKYTKDNITSTIPSVNRDIRIHLLDEIYYLKKYILYSINTKGNIRMKYLIDVKVSISLIDSLFDEIRLVKCCKNNKLDVAIDKLTNIKNIVYGWILNEEKSK